MTFECMRAQWKNSKITSVVAVIKTCFFYINWNGFLLRFIHFLSVQNAEKILSRSSIDQKLVFFSIDNINTIESFWQAVEHSEKETNR